MRYTARAGRGPAVGLPLGLCPPGNVDPQEDTMFNFTVHRFRFEVEAITPIAWYPYKGSSIRGALFGALRRHYCPAPDDPDPAHSAVCPVCWLMAREEPGGARGKTPPRAYAVEPPLTERTRFEPGERFSFGITLFAQAVDLLPYLVLAVPAMGEMGIGRPVTENGGRRGRFALKRIEAVNPLTGEQATVLEEGEQVVRVPDVFVRPEQVVAAADRLARRIAGEGGRLGVTFLTPTRIVEAGRLVHRPFFTPLFHRLLERLEALSAAYADAPLSLDKERLLPLADRVRLVEDRTRWVDIASKSRRMGRSTPIGGFVGEAVYLAREWGPLLEPLLWGQAVHVGKDAVKGNGWYRIEGVGG